MKRLLTTLILPTLFLATPATFAQVVTDTTPTTSSSAPSPAETVVPLYPQKAVKSLRKQGDEDIKPCGLISTGKATLVFSNLGAYEGGSYQDLVVSSSKDGSSWDRLSVAIPKFAPLGYQTNSAAVFDSTTKQVVLLTCVTPYATLAQGNSNKPDKKKKSEASGAPRFYVAFGKGGKFSKPKNVSKNFAGRRDDPSFSINGHGLFFQGICLKNGEHKGRLLFLACHQKNTVCSIYSDDHGRSWKAGTSAVVRNMSPNTLGNGLFLCEAEDGTVVSYTGDLNAGGAWLSSSDGGATWDEKKGEAGQPRSGPGHWPNAYIVLNTKDGNGTDSRLLAVSLLGNHQHTFHVALSYDWGRTWPHEKTIHCSTLNSQACLPIHPIAPGTLGVITSEKGGFSPTNCMDDAGFTTFTISWLTDGKDDGIDEEEAPAEGEAAE